MTQPLSRESKVINVFMRTLRLRENYMGHYKNANPDIEIDARIPALHIRMEIQTIKFLLQASEYLSPLFLSTELFHQYLFPTVEKDNDHDLSRISVDISSVAIAYEIQSGDFCEASVCAIEAFVHSKRGHKELFLVGGGSSGQTAVGMYITHIVRIESIQCRFT